jgi:hypothetical protein
MNSLGMAERTEPSLLKEGTQLQQMFVMEFRA